MNYRTEPNLFSDVEFEDRTEERDCLGRFIKEDSGGRVLWVDGARGCGKSYLVEQVLKLSGVKWVEVSVPVGSETKAQSYIKELIRVLQREGRLPLSSFISKNYSAISDLGAAVAKQAVKGLAKIDVDDVLDATAGMGKVFIDEHKNAEGLARVLAKYLKKRANGERFVVVFDNFSICDEESLHVLERVVLENCGEKGVFFILVTTTDDLSRQRHIRDFIERCGFPSATIEAFKSEKNFEAILTSGFECESDIDALSKMLYGICQGNPQMLVEVVRKAYSRCASEFGSVGKPRLPTEAVLQAARETPSDAYGAVAPVNPGELGTYERVILRIICTIGIEVTDDILLGIAEQYCRDAKIDAGGLASDALLNDAFSKLCYSRVIGVERDTRTVSISHDYDYKYYQGLFGQPFGAGTNRQFSNSIAAYLMDHEDGLEIPSSERDYAISAHTYNSDYPGWRDINRSYARRCFDRQSYFRAFEAFERIEGEVDDEELAMLLASAFESGQYEKCRSIAARHEGAISGAEYPFKSKCLFAAGKAAHITLNMRESQSLLREALGLASDEDERHRILGVLISSLRSGDANSPEARSLFMGAAKPLLQTADEDFEPEKWPASICKVLRNASYFLESEQAARALSRGLAIAREHRNELEEGYFLNNIGVVRIKAGEYSEAEKKLRESEEILLRIKPFEAAYPLQNRSTLELFEGDYPHALNLADTGFGLARSPYVIEALNTNRLMASVFLGERDRVVRRIASLESTTFDSRLDNDLVFGSNSMNLAVAYRFLDDSENATRCIKAAYEKSKGTKKDFRCRKIYRDVVGEEPPCDSLAPAEPWGETDFFTTTEFDPFLISISHE